MKKFGWLVLSVYASGISFFMSPFREDEKGWFSEGFGLNKKDADGKLSDGIQEALQRMENPQRPFHDLKNVSYEWVKLDPKRANKFYSWVILVQTLLILLLLLV